MSAQANGRAPSAQDPSTSTSLSTPLLPPGDPQSPARVGCPTAYVANLVSAGTDAAKRAGRWAVGVLLDGILWALDLLWFLWDGSENYFLSCNFAPVPECPHARTHLPIDGTIPDYLRGEFIRVGPNPKYRPRAGYHWFDGDGMLHGVRITGNSASYANRFVQTNKLKQEDTFGRSMFLKFGDLRGVSGLLRILVDKARFAIGIFDQQQGFGLANTAFVWHAGTLLVLNEVDKPYAIRVLEDGDLETLGRFDYGGALDHAFTAHPKVDPVTGELFTFCYSPESAPYLTYRVISATGNPGPKVPITLPYPVMMHDFSITENFAIFMAHPLVFDPKAMVETNSLPVDFKKDRESMFGILPRNDTTEASMRWFRRPPCIIFHAANSWEEGEEVVLLACRLEDLSLELEKTRVDQLLTEFRFNLRTGESSERALSGISCEFPRINERYVGRKNRFVYTAVIAGVTDIVGVAKFDVSRTPAPLSPDISDSLPPALTPSDTGDCLVGYFNHGKGRCGTEPVFVPRGGSSLGEDDGCLLNIVFDNSLGVSEVVITDAKSMAANPLAVIHLNCRVPFGFHGIFLPEEEIVKQKLTKPL